MDLCAVATHVSSWGQHHQTGHRPWARWVFIHVQRSLARGPGPAACPCPRPPGSSAASPRRRPRPGCRTRCPPGALLRRPRQRPSSAPRSSPHPQYGFSPAYTQQVLSLDARVRAPGLLSGVPCQLNAETDSPHSKVPALALSPPWPSVKGVPSVGVEPAAGVLCRRLRLGVSGTGFRWSPWVRGGGQAARAGHGGRDGEPRGAGGSRCHPGRRAAGCLRGIAGGRGVGQHGALATSGRGPVTARGGTGAGGIDGAAGDVGPLSAEAGGGVPAAGGAGGRRGVPGGAAAPSGALLRRGCAAARWLPGLGSQRADPAAGGSGAVE